MTSDEYVNQYTDNLRDFLRDFKATNQLISDEETGDMFLRWAILNAVEMFNITPPLLGNWDISLIPESMIIKKAAATVLESAAILYTRNQLPYVDPGGTSISFGSQGPGYQTLAQLFHAQWDQMIRSYKVARNIEDSWGRGVHSEYFWIQGGYFY